MVDRIMEQIEAIQIVLGADHHTSHLVPSWQDCDVMLSFMKALKPLKEMTDALSAEQSVTVSAVLPLLQHITSNLLMPTDDDANLTKEKQRVKADLESRYQERDLLFLSLCSFLDVRFKTEYLKDEDLVLEAVKDEMAAFFADILTLLSTQMM